MYIIISLEHSYFHEQFMTLWRPDNGGYCYAKQAAGIYEKPEKGYHDSEGNLPIEVDKYQDLFINHDNQLVIPNTKENWAKLGIKRSKHRLVRMSEEEVLKEFMKEHFPFSAMKQAGFFTKEMKGDYTAQAERVRTFFGFESIYEYGKDELSCHISYVGERPKDQPFITVINTINE